MGSGASVSDPRREEPEEAVAGDQVREDPVQPSTPHHTGVDAEERRGREDSGGPSEKPPPVLQERHVESAKEKRNPEEPEEPEKKQRTQTPGPAAEPSEFQVGPLHPLLFC